MAYQGNIDAVEIEPKPILINNYYNWFNRRLIKSKNVLKKP